jgi:CubicO group peptidase (beta-lactamase class C family)
MRGQIPGMTAAVASDREVIWTRGFGLADVAARRPATPDTVYHLASLTKPFAAAVLLQLVDEGRLVLETPASRFGIELPESPQVLHLLTHTSAGMPGERYGYDGNRFSQLDKVVTSLTGKSFAQIVGDRILTPLGLSDTAANPLLPAVCVESGRDPEAFARRLAQGYGSEGEAPVAYRARFSTAAGLVATASDMARFSIAWDTHRVVPEHLTVRAFTPARSRAGRSLPYGLGWFVQTRPRRLIWHYGYWVGASSLIVKMPDSGLTFVLLANSDGLSRKYDLGRDENVLRSPFARAFTDAFPR